jgi:competence ComEA-like helix-hairpin-helix protein
MGDPLTTSSVKLPAESVSPPVGDPPATIVRPSRTFETAGSRSVPPAPETTGWTTGDRRFLWVSCSVTAILLGLHTWRDVQANRAPVTIRSAVVGPATNESSQLAVPVLTPVVADDQTTSRAAVETTFQLDINTATVSEWNQLPGIGPTLAERIVHDRQTQGPFHSVDDLSRVKGIGAKTLAKLRPHLQPVLSPSTP